MPQTLDDFSVGDLILRHARAFPDKAALIVVANAADDAWTSVSYRELAVRAARRAHWLMAGANGLNRGDRVVLALPTGLEFAEAYVACLIGGLVAVPVPTPESSREAAHRFAGVVRDAEAGAVLAMERDVEELRNALAPEARALVRLVEPLPDDGIEPFATAAAGDLAVLQYTSGSIGDPKGVMISNANMKSNAGALAEALGLGPDDRIGGWVPMHHDMGLFAMLSTSLVLGMTCVLMPPMAFLKRPKDWLRVIDRHEITITAAPNFAYDMCLRTVSDADLDGLDLSRLRFAINGAEPIVEKVLREFTERFARAGLAPGVVTPGYGLAEATVFVSANSSDTLPRVFHADLDRLAHGELKAGGEAAWPLVGCGFPNDFDLRIVHPELCHEVPPGTIGEIWLRGPSVGLGYWRDPGATERTFRGTTRGDTGWLRTGDLGAVVDGELYVTGRRKEILIIRGRNLYPQDLEVEARASHSALHGLVGAAFSVPGETHEIPVIVHEVHPRTAAHELPAIVTAIQERLSARLGLAVDNVVLVRRGSVRRTTSGKIQRLAMRDRFLRGDLTWRHALLDAGTRRRADARREQAVGAGR
ncbi:fatty acyl-AMP ligase [Actinomadura sp. SCN-SB]|uniref:fatty acyl-AMP ligase n=1 Tax=Actinomadura sp. SCN-SB TaxID=3373092 RepID=UPI0037505974